MTLTASASTIRCDAVAVQFGADVLAVDGVNLVANHGQITALVGPSGCGKTTLLRLMAGLESPTSGTVTLDPPAESRLGEVAFVFQQPSLLGWRTALENVALPLELIGRGSKSWCRSEAREMLRCVDLSDAADRFPDQLSGGMKMRVSIARALVTRPRVLLLDEPFAALDEMLRNQLGELLLNLWDAQRFTVVMVTHNIGEAILLSHRIAVMREGRLRELIENPFSFPRSVELQSTPDFGNFYGRVGSVLRGQS